MSNDSNYNSDEEMKVILSFLIMNHYVTSMELLSAERRPLEATWTFLLVPEISITIRPSAIDRDKLKQ